MRHETVTIHSDLEDVLDAFQRDRGDQSDAAGFSALVDAALRQYLRVRGYVPDSDYRPLRLPPDERGSGRADISVEHDRYLYETSEFQSRPQIQTNAHTLA